jgi:hypothetical protein
MLLKLSTCYFRIEEPICRNPWSVITAVMAKKTDIRMMISFCPPCTCDTSGRTWQSCDFGTLNWLSTLI